MDPITRREFLAGAAGASLVGASAGRKLPSALARALQGPYSDAAPSGVVAPLAHSGGLPKCTLRLAIPSGPEADAHVALAPEFKKYSKGKVTVEVEQYGRSDQYEQKYLTLMKAKSSEWDLVRIVPLDFLLWGPNGWLMPFTKYMKDPTLFNAKVFNFNDYLPALVDLISYKGQVYSFIQEASAMLTFYRKDLLAKYGGVKAPPEIGWSYDEVTAISKKMLAGMKADGLKTYPFFFEGSAEQANCTLWQQANSSGRPMMTPGFKPQLTAPAIESSVAWAVSLEKQGLVPPSVSASGYAEGITVFQQDIAAMGEQWNAGAINLLDPKQSPNIHNKMGFAVLPYDPAAGPKARRLYASVWSVGVSSYSQYPEAAFEYAAWFSSPEIARETVLKGGGSSGRQSLLHEPAILASNPQYKALADSFAYYAPWPATPAASYIVEVLMVQTGTKLWSAAPSTAGINQDLAGLDSAILAYLKQEGISVS
jgi:multiple sugar transport system substrate-binding protein